MGIKAPLVARRWAALLSKFTFGLIMRSPRGGVVGSETPVAIPPKAKQGAPRSFAHLAPADPEMTCLADQQAREDWDASRDARKSDAAPFGHLRPWRRD